MKIIFVNRYFHPDQSATSRMVSGLAFSLARRGYEVEVMTSRHFHERGNIALPKRERIAGVSVHRIATSSFGRAGTIGRAADYLTFHGSAAAWLAAHARRGDLCVLCTDPPLLSLSATAALRLRGARAVNWVMDLFPETAIELGLVPSNAATRAILALRDRTNAVADLLICPTASMARYLESRGATTRGGTAIVHHWSDGSEIHPVPRERNGLRTAWGLGDKFVVGYSGNFGRAHDFATLLDAAERLAAESDIAFLLIGGGQQHAAVKAEVARRRLANVVFQPLQPAARLAESLGASDVHIVSLLPRLEHCIVPSKAYGILAAARPALFVGDPQGEVATLLRRGKCGAAFLPGDGQGLAARIRAMRDDPRRSAAMGLAARRLFESEYDYEEGVTRWLRAVSPLLEPPHPALVPASPGSLAS